MSANERERAASAIRHALALGMVCVSLACSSESRWQDARAASGVAPGSSALDGEANVSEKLVPPVGQVLFGAFATMDETLTRARFEEFASDAGKRPAIHMIFRDWPDDGRGDFPLEFARVTDGMGAVPMVTWEPWWGYSHERYPLLEDIATGRHDAFIVEFLEQAASFGRPWFLRFAHEMEGTFYPWTTAHDARQSPENYIAAFRHIAALVRRIAPLTLMVWSPNSGTSAARLHYPGDASVDWIGASLYNFPDAPQDPDHADKLGRWVPMVRDLDKPAMIAEMGCAERYTITAETVATGGADTPVLERWMDLEMANKSACLDRVFDLVEQRYPEIRALVWFDIDREADWRIASGAESRTTFTRRIADPRYVSAPFPVPASAR